MLELTARAWRADVAGDEDGDLTVPGLGDDAVDGHTGLGGGGGVAGAERVAGDPICGQAGRKGAVVEGVGNRDRRDRF